MVLGWRCNEEDGADLEILGVRWVRPRYSKVKIHSMDLLFTSELRRSQSCNTSIHSRTDYYLYQQPIVPRALAHLLSFPPLLISKLKHLPPSILPSAPLHRAALHALIPEHALDERQDDVVMCTRVDIIELALPKC